MDKDPLKKDYLWSKYFLITIGTTAKTPVRVQYMGKLQFGMYTFCTSPQLTVGILSHMKVVVVRELIGA